MMSSDYQARDEQGSQQRTKNSLYPLLVRDAITVGTLGLVLLWIHQLSPFVRGFHCNDETIRYPFKESTVSSGLCYFTGTATNVVLILMFEYIKLTKQTRAQSTSAGDTEGNKKFDLRVYAANVYCRLLIWLFGAITSELFTDVSKVFAGRLRPHFISVCQPTIQGYGELSDYCRNTPDPYAYIIKYECGGDPRRQRDARLSFLSGHSSYSAYSATFALFYIQEAADVNKLGLLKPFLQVLISSTAFYTGLSRISDYKHHWQDVLAGLLLGTLIASVVLTYVWPSFSNTYKKYLNNNTTNKRVNTNEVSIGELHRLDY